MTLWSFWNELMLWIFCALYRYKHDSCSVTILLPAIHGRSSFLHTVEDHYLVGHVRDRQKVSSVLSCAQLCLKRWPLCRSVNYGKKEESKICELNDEGIESADTGVASLQSMPGFIFAQLRNAEVCKTGNYL